MFTFTHHWSQFMIISSYSFVNLYNSTVTPWGLVTHIRQSAGTSLFHAMDTKVSDLCLIDVDPRRISQHNPPNITVLCLENYYGITPNHPGSSLHWRHNDHDGVSNHQPHHWLLNRLYRRRSRKTSKLRVTGLCVGNSPGPVNSPHKGPVTRKMFPFDDVIMWTRNFANSYIKRIVIPTGLFYR